MRSPRVSEGAIIPGRSLQTVLASGFFDQSEKVIHNFASLRSHSPQSLRNERLRSNAWCKSMRIVNAG